MALVEINDCMVNVALGGQINFRGSLVVERGDRISLIGPNGAGKTTLLMLMSGLMRANGGKVLIFGGEPSIRNESFRRRVGLLLQHPDDQLLAPTVAQDVGLSLRALRVPESEIETRVSELLEELGITHLAKRAPHHLSGGEKKLVALAGAMVHSPDLLLLDEPFAGLDGFSAVNMVRALQKFVRNGSAVVISSHEVGGIEAWSDKTYIVRDGQLVGPVPVEKIADECRNIRVRGEGYPELPAIYSRLLVERFSAN